MSGGGVEGRLYLDEGWAVEQFIAGIADLLAFTALHSESVLEYDIRGRSEADVSRVVCFLEARATRPHDMDAARYAAGMLVRDDDLEAARRIRVTYAAVEGRTLRWAPKPSELGH